MKIEYRFVTGEKVTAEISDEFKDVVIKLDKEEYNCNRKETRRHKSLSLSDKSIENMSISSDICDDVFKNIDKEKLHNAISRLKPNEQELINKIKSFGGNAQMTTLQRYGHGIVDKALLETDVVNWLITSRR